MAARGTWLKGLLLNMRDKVWRPVAGGVARVGRRAGPSLADADLADVMRTDAISNSLPHARMLGRHYLAASATRSTRRTSAARPSRRPRISAKMLQLLGLPTAAAQLPRLGHAFYATRHGR